MLHGGGAGYESGLPVNNIESFLPTLIPDLVLWIKANKTYLKEETIESYCNKQSYFIQEKLREQFKTVLNSSVITEILSDTPQSPNSLVPLNLDTSLATIFPALRIIPNELDAINISNYRDPITNKRRVLQLVTVNPVTINDATPYSISHGITISQNNITRQIIISSEFIEDPVQDTLAKPSDAPTLDPAEDIFKADVEATGEISELILYSRKLNPEENSKMEGYLAYKQNTQYALPVGHPYLPNTLKNPIFSKILIELGNLENSIHALNAQLDIALNDYKNEYHKPHELGIINKENLAKIIQNIIGLIGAFSKGFLYARKINSPTLETVYKSIIEKNWYPTRKLSETTFTELITEYKMSVEAVDIYIKSLKNNSINTFTVSSQSGGSFQDLTTQISDHLLFVQQKEESKKLYQPLITRQVQFLDDGTIAYNSLQNEFKNELTNYIDAFNYKSSDIEQRMNEIKTTLDPIQALILSGKWLTYLPTIDTATTSTKEYGEEIIKYNDTAINSVYRQYIYLKQQMQYGDYAHIKTEIDEMKPIFALIKTQSLNPVFRLIYIEYLKNLLDKTDSYYKEFEVIHTTLLKCLTNIESFITIAKETGEVSSTTNPINSHMNSMQHTLQTDIYLRKVIPIDTNLLGLDYVETTMDGYLPNTKVTPFYPEFIGYKFVDGLYVKETVYKTITGAPVIQNYHILKPFSESVYKGLTNTILSYYTLDSLFEIDRENTNSIHCITGTNKVPPVLLPFSLNKNAWYLIYNIGEIPICVQQNENIIDMIGPNNGILYIYTNNEKSPYAPYLWTENQLPYDTILNIPRTNLSMYIDEIGTSIYIRKKGEKYEPVYTMDGYFVEVIKADDGFVYDIDDVYRSNPYNVTSVGLEKRTQLIFNPNSKKMVKILPQTFSISEDLNTGFAILLNVNGTPGINEYGFAKFIKTPIQCMQNIYKIQGAYGDLVLKPTEISISVPHIAEPFLKFETVFRTRFAASNSIKNIFITNTLNPIVDPNGIAIEVPPITEGKPSFYTEDSVDYEIIVMNPIQTNISSKIYAYKNYPDTSKTDRVNLQFINAKKYIQVQIDKIDTYKNSLKSFGKEAIDACDEIQEKYRPFLTNLEQNNSIFETGQTLTEEAFANVFLSIKTNLDNFLVKFKEGTDILKTYTRAIEEIKSVNDSVDYWSQAGSDKLNGTIAQINLSIQDSTTKFGTTPPPEFTRIIQECLDAQTMFNDALKTVMNYIMTPPTLVSEVHPWYTFIQPKIEQLEMIYDNVQATLNIEIPFVIKKYESNQIYGNLSSKIQSTFETIQVNISNLRDKKTALETYLQLSSGKLTPEQVNLQQTKLTHFDNQIANNDIQYNTLYKQVKTQPATQELLNKLQQFQLQLDLQSKEN
jgi:hypothetical protein